MDLAKASCVFIRLKTVCLACLQVMQAYQAGVSALRLSLKDVTVERAESLVDQIQEVLLQQTVYFNHLLDSSIFVNVPFILTVV